MSRVYELCQKVLSGPYPDGWKLCERPARGSERCELHPVAVVWPSEEEQHADVLAGGLVPVGLVEGRGLSA